MKDHIAAAAAAYARLVVNRAVAAGRDIAAEMYVEEALNATAPRVGLDPRLIAAVRDELSRRNLPV